jgi:TetR/AcrR family transcriptional regulator, mexJK operon transcriptional repressor
MSAQRAYPRSGRERPVPPGVPRRPTRGGRLGASERKREAIVQAAVRLFLRDGFERTSVDAIADEAGVSKRTIYNHYGDKENLFLSVIGDTYHGMIAVFEQLIDRYLTDVSGEALEANVIAFACETALTAARSPDRTALIRLMMSEGIHFPELRVVQMRPRGITAIIADRLTTLAARGVLEISEPEEAANHLFSLTMGQMNNRSLFGAVQLSDEEIRRMATSGARAFLRAYLPR